MRSWLAAFLLLALVALAGCPGKGSSQRADELLGSERGFEVSVECVSDVDCKDDKLSTKDLCNFEGKCEHPEIADCVSGDGFCPPNCKGSGDTECEVDKCKSNAECNDNNPKTKDECTGTPKKCANAEVTGCLSADGLCPAGCNALSDSDCKNLPVEAKTCKSASECDDDNLETADGCSGDPPRCIHKTVKNCVDRDGVCPKTCSPETDTDCQDACMENADCNDGKAETIDRCEGHPKRCKNTLVTECTDGDGVCLASCSEANDSDCACENGDNSCPHGCDFTNDDNCPKKNLCETEYGCNDGLKYTNDECRGTPKVCEHTFLDGSQCGSLDVNASNDTTAADCFCLGYNGCDKLGITVTSSGGQNVLAYTVRDLDGSNCLFDIYPKKVLGKDIDPRLSYQTTCSKLDTGTPEVVGSLRGGLALTGNNCVAEVKRFFNSFPDLVLTAASNCRGGFTEYYASEKEKGN